MRSFIDLYHLTCLCMFCTNIPSSLFINLELDAATATSSSTATATATTSKVSSQPSTSSHVEVPRSVPSAVAVAAASPPIKYQYYQSAECLNISILAKGLLPSEVIQFAITLIVFYTLFIYSVYVIFVCVLIYQFIH